MFPVVKRELLSSGIQSYKSNPNFVKDLLTKISTENPVLMSLVFAALDSEEVSDGFKEGYIRGACQFYYLLEAQSQCDELER